MINFTNILTDLVLSAGRAAPPQVATLAHLFVWALSKSGRSGASEARAAIQREVIPQTRLSSPPAPGPPPSTFDPSAVAASFASFYANRTPPAETSEAVLDWLLEGRFTDDGGMPGQGTASRCRDLCKRLGGRPPLMDESRSKSAGELVDDRWLLKPLDELVGRSGDMQRMLGRLTRAIEKKQMLVMEGPPGVGKSLFLSHVIHQASARFQISSDAALRAARFLILTPAGVVGPGADIGDRLAAVADELQHQPNLVLVVDGLDIFLIPSTRLAQEFVSSLGGILAAGGRTILLVGRTGVSRQSDLLRAAAVGPLPPLSRDATFDVVRRRLDLILADDRLASDDSDGFCRLLLDMAEQRYPGRFYPEVAIHLAESAAGRAVSRTLYLKQEPFGRLTTDDLWQHVAEEQGLQSELIGRNPDQFYTTVRAGLVADVLGQDHAADAIVQHLRGQLGRPPRREPRGRFLLVGPPGVGKTAFGRALAKRLGYGEEAFAIFSMSEYGTDAARTRFLGADPGYVGFRSTRTVFDLVQAHPSCVVLLDEIDRADASLQDILLGILEGEGKDSEGKSVYFSQAVFIMTTNLGQEAVERAYANGIEAGKTRGDLAAEFRDEQLRPLILAGLTDATEDAIGRYLDAQIAGTKHAFQPDGPEQESLGAIARLVELREMRQRLQAARRTSPLDRAFLDRLDIVIPFFPLLDDGLRKALLDLHLRRAGWADCPEAVRESILVKLAAETRPGETTGPSVRAMQRLIEAQCGLRKKNTGG